MSKVVRFSIAPVRSLGLEHPSQIVLTDLGVAEDRRFYLIDDDGRFIDRVVVGRLVQVAAHTDSAGELLRLTLPDGTVLEGPVELGGAVETHIYSRTALGHEVIGPWASALEPFAGRRVRIVRTDHVGGTRRGKPVSILTQGSLDELARQSEVPEIDARRFRMLIELDGAIPHEEDQWLGGQIGIGETVLRVTELDGRCAITTQDPDTGERDLDTLRTIVRYRGLMPDAKGAPKAMFGVLAEVERPGRIRLGDQVRVLA